MTSLAAVSSEATCLPPLRSVFGSGSASYHLNNNNNSGGSTTASAEDDDALPLLISMAHCANKSAAAESSRLPTLSSFLSRCSQIAPSTPADCATAASPAPQPSPSSPSTLSPGLFGISTMAMPFSGSTSAFAPTASPASSPIPILSSPSADTYASATNGLLALSDIISSTPALPVPSSSNSSSSSLALRLHALGDSVDTCFAPVDSVDKDEGATSPVSSRTRRGTRGQQKPRQKPIEKVMAAIELERQRRLELEHTLKLALQERDILIAAKSTSGVPRAHSMPALGESPLSDADLDISSAERSKSVPMLPPIGSVPALSPYLKRKRGSLPPPSSEELEEEAAVSVRGLANGRRRRNTVGQDDEDGDYEPTARKAVKRCRSMSEGGRRLQAAAAATSSRRRSASQHQPRVSAYEVGQQADMVALHLEAKHAKMSLCNDDSNDDGEAERSRSSVDIEEGPDQEDDYCAVYQPRRSQESASTSSRTQSRRDSVLDFMKDHPHAAFWLKVRN